LIFSIQANSVKENPPVDWDYALQNAMISGNKNNTRDTRSF